jgi:U3 small nucleolar ribonucleoprotein component
VVSRLTAPDENHPKGDPLFAFSIAALKKHNLPHEEKRQRRQAVNKKYYAENKKNIAKLRLKKRRGYS